MRDWKRGIFWGEIGRGGVGFWRRDWKRGLFLGEGLEEVGDFWGRDWKRWVGFGGGFGRGGGRRLGVGGRCKREKRVGGRCGFGFCKFLLFYWLFCVVYFIVLMFFKNFWRCWKVFFFIF